MAKRLGFTYMYCNDLQKMKWFYTEILKLNLIWESEKSIAFKIGDHQLSIDVNEDFCPPSQSFSIQPGWEGGTVPRTSWSLECDKKDFKEIINLAIKYEVPRFYSEPKWNGYWSFPVLDPMNNTVEVTCTSNNIEDKN